VPPVLEFKVGFFNIGEWTVDKDISFFSSSPPPLPFDKFLRKQYLQYEFEK